MVIEIEKTIKKEIDISELVNVLREEAKREADGIAVLVDSTLLKNAADALEYFEKFEKLEKKEKSPKKRPCCFGKSFVPFSLVCGGCEFYYECLNITKRF